jgi:hypothetical protein
MATIIAFTTMSPGICQETSSKWNMHTTALLLLSVTVSVFTTSIVKSRSTRKIDKVCLA